MQDATTPPSDARHVTVTEGGRSVEFVLPHAATDHIQKHIATTMSFYEVAMLRHARSHIQPGDLAIDVGAYIGNHTLYFAGICGANVTCFEPHPDSYRQLTRNVEASGVSHLVVPIQAGVGRVEGFATSRVVDASNGGSNQLSSDTVGSVRVVRLDDQRFDRAPRVIKIDVEGMEIDVLLGAEQTIRTARPLLYVECSEVDMLERVVDLLTGWGFAPIGQFNATPTVCFHSADGTSLQRQLTQLAWATDRSFSKLSKKQADLERHHLKQAALLERSASLLETQRQLIADLTAALAAHHAVMSHLEARVDRVGEGVHEGLVGIQRTERDLHTMMLRTDSALKELSGNSRTSSSTTVRPRQAKSAPPKAAGTQRLRTEMFARARRKLRKLERDPDSFFEDSKFDFVRTTVGPFYMRELRKRRGK